MSAARALVGLALAAIASTGCVGTIYSERNAPGHVAQLAAPPQDLRAPAIDHGEDPGARGWLGHATLLGGGEIDQGKGGGTAGLELGAAPFALAKSPTRVEAFDEAVSKVWLRPSVGWMFVRGEGETRTHVGPLYAELQAVVWFSRHLGAMTIGVGPRVQLAREDAGAQSTACVGVHPALTMLCLRGAVEANRGAELSIMVSATAFGTWWWSK